jgi:ATP-binding cassette, subfamily C, bacterial
MFPKMKQNQKPFRLILKMAREYPYHAVLTVFALLMRGLMEGLSLALLLPLIAVMLRRENGDSALEQAINKTFSFIGLEPTLPFLLVFMVAAITLKVTFSLLATTQASWTSARIVADLRLKLLNTLLAARWRHYEFLPSGQIASAITLEAQLGGGTYNPAARMFASAAQVLAQASVALFISWKVTLAGLLLGGVIALFLSGFVRRTRVLGKSRKDLTESLTTRVIDALGSMKALKAMGVENRLVSLLESEINAVKRVMRTTKLIGEAVRVLPEPIATAGLAVILFIFVSNDLGSIESLAVLALLFSRTVQSVSQVQQSFQSVVANEAAYWFVDDLINDAEREKEEVNNAVVPKFRHDIRFEEVGFAYGETRIFDALSFKIPFGAVISLVGKSGAGKTTLIDLVVALRSPTTGKILIDGVPLNDFDRRAWRKLIGYVPQDTTLFHQSIKTNVTLGDLDLTVAEVEKALQDAGAWEFVRLMPEGMDTIVGERGSRLSGGQRQRIAIARALIRDPDLLILDEPTTAVDPEVERAIVETLKLLAGKKTIITISHQQTLKHFADIILELEDGKIRQQKASKDHHIDPVKGSHETSA